MVNAPLSPTGASGGAPALVEQSNDKSGMGEATGLMMVKSKSASGGGSSEGGEAASAPNLPPPDVAASIPCRYFPVGQCKYGDACAFSHKQSPAPETASSPVPTPELAQAPPQQPSGTPSPPSLIPGTLPMPPVSGVDMNGYPLHPGMPPQYYYYGMPQPYYGGGHMPYGPPGYIDANGEYRSLAGVQGPMPGYGLPYPQQPQPYPEFAAPQYLNPSPPSASPSPSVPTPQSHDLTSPSPVTTMHDPRYAEGHPAAMAVNDHGVPLPPFPHQQLHPAMMQSQNIAFVPQPMSPIHPGHERHYSNGSYGGHPPPRPMVRSQPTSSHPRRGPNDSYGRTASAIISLSPSPTSRTFPSHGRYATEQGTRSTASAITRVGGSGYGGRNYPCVFFPENRCRNGDSCHFTHLLPSGEDARHLGKGMIGIDGRTKDPAESSKTFVFPGRGRGGIASRPMAGRLGPMRGGYGSSQRFSQHGSMNGGESGTADDLTEMMGGMSVDGMTRMADDEARERIERFVASTRGGGGMSNRPYGGEQRVPSVGDFPALEAMPLSPKQQTLHHHEEGVDGAVAKLTASFASAAARGLSTVVSSTSAQPSVTAAVESTPPTMPLAISV